MPGIWRASRPKAAPSLSGEDARPRFGVLTGRKPSAGRMPEDRLCRMLAEAGEREGEPVIVFGPDGAGALLARGFVKGWMLRAGDWVETAAPIPPVVFDRRFPRTPAERAAGNAAVRALRASGAAMLGGTLPGKAEVAEALAVNRTLAPLLPPTYRWRPGRTAGLLARHPDGLFLKPSSGMQGRGTIALRPDRAEGGYRLDIRTSRNAPAAIRSAPDELDAAIARIARGRPYVAQPLLRLSTPEGAPFDVRIFVQKDGAGRWRIAGVAARVGPVGTATSNLHGGGGAVPAAPLLAALFGREAARRMLRRARRAALVAARAAERSFGRLAELGLDFGIDQDGRLWLLEANARPGRAILRLYGSEAEREAAERTLASGRRLREANAPLAAYCERDD